MLRSDDRLVKKDSPLCWSSRDEITSYFDLDLLGKAEATQSRAKVLWQVLVEGVLNHGSDEVGSARYILVHIHLSSGLRGEAELLEFGQAPGAVVTAVGQGRRVAPTAVGEEIEKGRSAAPFDYDAG
jgi:hypothetical protein